MVLVLFGDKDGLLERLQLEWVKDWSLIPRDSLYKYL
jgi:hypothetical protein